MINRLSFFVFIGLALTSRSFAIPFTMNATYNTGYTPTYNFPGVPTISGVALAPGSSDLFFTLYSAYPAPFTGNSVVIPQSLDGPGWVTATGAQWIGPVEDESGNSSTSSPTAKGGLAGIYDYSSDFSSNFLVPTEVTMTGAYAADDGVSLFVNGALVSSTPPEAFANLHSFSFTFLVNARESIIPIDFVVNNLANGGSGSTNPTGLLVSNLKFVQSAVAPEPGTWAMLFAGVGMLVLVHRTRRARSC